MSDVLTILQAALIGASIPLLVWGGERALAHLLPAGGPWRATSPAWKRSRIALAACMALVFAWAPFRQFHTALALQTSFVAWALGGSVLAVVAPWVIWRSRWLRVQQGRPLNALGRLVMLLLLEPLAVTACAEDFRDWFPGSSAAHVLQSVAIVASTILLIICAALILLGMLNLLSQRADLGR